MHGIYQIRNLVNNKIYIGSTKNFIIRKRSHFNNLRENKHKNNHLQNSFNKYGEQNFVFEIIEIIENIEELIGKEQEWINKTECYNESKGFNIRKIANSNEGLKHSEEYKLNKSILYKGRKTSKKTKEKHRNQYQIHGDNHPFSKINSEIVKEIRSKYLTRNYSQKKLSIEYNLSKSHIKNIVNNDIWFDLEYNPPKNEFCKKIVLRNNLKLNYSIAKEIRKRYENENISFKELSLCYNVSTTTIQKIINNKMYILCEEYIK